MSNKATIEDFATWEIVEEIERRNIEDPIKAIKAVLKLNSQNSKEDIIKEINKIY